MQFQALALILLALFLGGCGNKTATVTGKLIENGQPKTFQPTQAAIQMTLVGPDGQLDDTHSYTAVVDQDGSFEVVASGGELPIGKYQLAVQFTGGNPKYQAFAAPHSPLRKDIKAGKNEIIVDLAKPPE